MIEQSDIFTITEIGDRVVVLFAGGSASSRSIHDSSQVYCSQSLDLFIGKSYGGHLTHHSRPDDRMSSLCGLVKGALQIEPMTQRVGCSICRRMAVQSRR